MCRLGHESRPALPSSRDEGKSLDDKRLIKVSRRHIDVESALGQTRSSGLPVKSFVFSGDLCSGAAIDEGKRAVLLRRAMNPVIGIPQPAPAAALASPTRILL